MSECWDCGHGSVLDCLREHLRPTTNWLAWHAWRRWHAEPDLPGFVPTIWSTDTAATIEVSRQLYSAFDEDEAWKRLDAIGTVISIPRLEDVR